MRHGLQVDVRFYDQGGCLWHDMDRRVETLGRNCYALQNAESQRELSFFAFSQSVIPQESCQGRPVGFPE